MAQGTIIAGDVEILLVAALGVLLTLIVLGLARRHKPDPKIALLLSLVEGLPRNGAPDDPPGKQGEEESQHCHGPMGPSGFTLST